MLYTNLQVCLLVVNFSGSRWWGEVGKEVRRGGRHRDEEDDEEEEDEGGEEEEEEEVQLEASRTGKKQQQQNWVSRRRVCGGSKAAGGSFRGWCRHLETSPPHKNRPPKIWLMAMPAVSIRYLNMSRVIKPKHQKYSYPSFSCLQ